MNQKGMIVKLSVVAMLIAQLGTAVASCKYDNNNKYVTHTLSSRGYTCGGGRWPAKDTSSMAIGNFQEYKDLWGDWASSQGYLDSFYSQYYGFKWSSFKDQLIIKGESLDTEQIYADKSISPQ